MSVFKIAVKRNKDQFIILGAITVAVSCLLVILPYIYGNFIDCLVKGRKTPEITRLILCFTIGHLLKTVLDYYLSLCREKLIRACVFDIRVNMIKHLRHIALLEYQKYDVLYLTDRIRLDILDIVTFGILNYMDYILQGLLFIAYLVLVARIDSTICLGIIALIPIYLLVYQYFKKRLYNAGVILRENAAYNNKVLNEQMLLMEEIRIDAQYKHQDDYVMRFLNIYFKSYDVYARKAFKLINAHKIISAIFQMALFFYAARTVRSGELSIGNLVIALSFFQNILNILTYYVEVARDYPQIKASFDRVQEILTIPEEEEGTECPSTVTSIEAEIAYQYLKSDKLLQYKKFKGHKGKIYGIMGENGCGKSTFIKLLIGLLKSKTGKLNFNSRESSAIDFEVLRREKIGYVTQMHAMTNKTVAELFGEIIPDISLEQVEKIFSIMDKEEREKALYVLKKNWNVDYRTLSEGQKQLVAILRALIKRPEVLIMDEPTASIDKSYKLWFKKVLSEIKKNIIILVVSHDKELLAECDELYDARSL